MKAAGGDVSLLTPLGDELEAVFLDAYRSADGPSDGVVSERIRLYETVSLLRLAVHAWQKFKPERLGRILAVLDARQELTV